MRFPPPRRWPSRSTGRSAPISTFRSQSLEVETKDERARTACCSLRHRFVDFRHVYNDSGAPSGSDRTTPPWKARRTTERRLESTAPLRVPVRAAALAQPFGGILPCAATREIACVPPAGRHALDSRTPPAGSRSLPYATPPGKHTSVRGATARANRSRVGEPQSPSRANHASAGRLAIHANSPDRCSTCPIAGMQMIFFSRRALRSGLPGVGTSRIVTQNAGCNATLGT